MRGRYRLGGTVAEGRAGSVIQAVDEVHERRVAIKTRELTSDDDERAARSEAATLYRMVPHPSLPVLREDFIEGHAYHLVFDWIDGVDLETLIRRDGEPGLPDEQIVAWLSQVSSAIDHLHQHEPPVIHRDVKPANVIVTRSGRVVLVDLGLSALHDARAAGTRAYLAPEVAAGEVAAPAADLYGLAATAYHAYFGEPPSDRAFLDGARGRAVQIATAVRRGLSPDPGRRPPTASAFMAQLAPAPGPTNIRSPVTSFVGRERESSDLARLLERQRFITVTGPPGVGKSRLASSVAMQNARRFEDGTFVVNAAADADRLPAAVIEAVGATDVDGLAASRMLIVLDGCEAAVSAVSRSSRVGRGVSLRQRLRDVPTSARRCR